MLSLKWIPIVTLMPMRQHRGHSTFWGKRGCVALQSAVSPFRPLPLPPVEQRRRRLTTEDIYRSWGVRPLEFESDVEMEVEIEAGRNEFDFPLRAISAE